MTTCTPLPRDPAATCTDWQGRRDGEPDIYLLIPGGDNIGVKWREGLLQIKGRVAAGEAVDFGPHGGRIERWTKWSYPGLPQTWQSLFSASYNDTGRRTVAVGKRRRLRLVRIRDDGEFLEVPSGQIIARGVSIELTEIRLADRDCVTVGFEAFPDDAVTARKFREVVAAFLAELAEPRLLPAQSASYPEWLAGLTTLR